MIGGEYIGDWIKETLGGRGDLNAQEGHVPVGSRGAEALNPGRGWGTTYNVYSSHLGMFQDFTATNEVSHVVHFCRKYRARPRTPSPGPGNNSQGLTTWRPIPISPPYPEQNEGSPIDALKPLPLLNTLAKSFMVGHKMLENFFAGRGRVKIQGYNPWPSGQKMFKKFVKNIVL